MRCGACLAIIGLFAVTLAVGCDQPLKDMSPVPDGTYTQVQQAARSLIEGAIGHLIDDPIGGCMPCSDCVSDACVIRTCSCGLCAAANKVNGTSCDNGNKCDGIETCKGGVCSAGTPVSCVAMDVCHAAGTCVPATGSCSTPAAPDGTSCDNGNKCDGIESCRSGVCSAGTAVTCTVEDRCHGMGTCNPSTGVCSNPALADGVSCDDGNKCNGIESCRGGVCSAGTAVTCAVQDGCHKVGTCDPASGTCSQPPAADGTACGSDNKCFSSAACKAGVCTVGAPVGCPAKDKCHGPGTCDPLSGACSNPTLADGADCDDGDQCNGPDVCRSGVCTSGPAVVCLPPDVCQTATCLRASGTCVYAPTSNCTDAGPSPADGASGSVGGSGTDAPRSISDAANDSRPGGDAAPADRPLGSGGVSGSGHADAGAGPGGGGAVIGPCSYAESGFDRGHLAAWLIAGLALALRRGRRSTARSRGIDSEG